LCRNTIIIIIFDAIGVGVLVDVLFPSVGSLAAILAVLGITSCAFTVAVMVELHYLQAKLPDQTPVPLVYVPVAPVVAFTNVYPAGNESVTDILPGGGAVPAL
jgi:hypothetical protein